MSHPFDTSGNELVVTTIREMKERGITKEIYVTVYYDNISSDMEIQGASKIIRTVYDCNLLLFIWDTNTNILYLFSSSNTLITVAHGFTK